MHQAARRRTVDGTVLIHSRAVRRGSADHRSGLGEFAGIFTNLEGELHSETYNQLNAFFAGVPGNYAHNLRKVSAAQFQLRRPLVPVHYRPRRRPARQAAQRVGEDRYRPGGRRTSAEPLSASWKPHVETPREQPEPPKAGLAKFTKTYGWRVYALPILVVLTVLVVVNTANSPAEPIAEQGAPAGVESAGVTPRRRRDRRQRRAGHPGEPGHAGRPQGADRRPARGHPVHPGRRGKWHVVPGSGPKVGSREALHLHRRGRGRHRPGELRRRRRVRHGRPGHAVRPAQAGPGTARSRCSGSTPTSRTRPSR